MEPSIVVSIVSAAIALYAVIGNRMSQSQAVTQSHIRHLEDQHQRCEERIQELEARVKQLETALTQSGKENRDLMQENLELRRRQTHPG